jgi:hypothetical protein
LAKKSAFDEIISAPFRWPTRGDVAFAEADDPYDDAHIAADDLTRLVLMIDGYKRAADLAVAIATENRSCRDSLVYPVVFNYRHFLELSLKHLIASYGPSVGIDPVWDTHDLHRLWRTFERVLQEFGTDDPDDADPIVGSVIAQFAKIDPKSDAHRYPVDRTGAPLPIAFARTHLENLAHVMNAVSGYFTGCDGYLGSLTRT